MRYTTLRDLVAASGRTQRDVAEAARLSEQYLSDLICGRRASPGFAVLVRLADALGFPVAMVVDAVLRSVERAQGPEEQCK